jgi:hypothetical protein
MYNPALADTIFAHGKRRYVNAYLPGLVPVADHNWRAGTAWQMVQAYYLDVLGTDQFRQLFQWLAHNVQHPGQRINWCPVLVGVQGDGKTTLGEILGRVMGADNVQPIGVAAIASSFNDWAHGACVGVLEELRIHGQSRHSVLDSIKPLLTNDTIQIHPKGQKPRAVLNTQNYIGLTNNLDALALDEGDRRYAVLKTRFEDRAELLRDYPAAFWAKMYAAINGNIGELRGWLLDFDMIGFNWTQAPAHSVHHRAMATASMGVDQAAARRAIAAGGDGVGPDVLSSWHLNRVIEGNDDNALNTTRIARALEAEDWVQRDGRIKWDDNKKRQVWVRKGSGLLKADPSVIREHLDRTTEPDFPPVDGDETDSPF